MPVAAMANPPEHDFAPSWLKIPSDNQLIAKPHSDQRSGSKHPSHSSRSRHSSGESSYQGYQPRQHQQPNIQGYSSRDDKRYRGPRYHSLEDPLRHTDLPGTFSPFHPPNGFLPPYFSSLDYQYPHPHLHHGKRAGGTPLHQNLNSHNYHGRGNGYGNDHGRGRYGSGGGGARHRNGVSDKGGPENGETSALENGVGGRNQKGEEGSGEGGKDGGKSKSEDSALSTHDFPSLSGDGQKEKKKESSKPVGAWEKRPETARVNIAGKKLQLVQKTTASDAPTSNGAPQSAAGRMSSPSGGVNVVTSLSSGVKASVVQQAATNKGRSSSSSSTMYKSLVPKTATPNKATQPRKPLTKEIVIRPAPVISNKEKSTPPLPPSSSSSSSTAVSSTSSSSPPTFSSTISSSSSTSSSTPSSASGKGTSQSSSPVPTKEQVSPRSTPAVDIPTPRMVTGRVKRTDKVDFLKELRRSGSVDSPRIPRDIALVNGTDHNRQNELQHDRQQFQFKASTKNYVKSQSTTIYQQPDPFDDIDDHNSSTDINQHLNGMCNGHANEDDIDNDEEENIDDNRHKLVIDNGHFEVLEKDDSHLDCQPMELSSSLEAEKRLLHQMGWHEHSDDEDDFAPITEDELKEFKLRSQQLKKNGVSKPIMLNLTPHPVITAMTSMVIEDNEVSSCSDSSDDEL